MTKLQDVTTQNVNTTCSSHFLDQTCPQSIKKACQIVTKVSNLIPEGRQVFALCAVTTFTFVTQRSPLWGRKVKGCLSNKKQTTEPRTKNPQLLHPIL